MTKTLHVIPVLLLAAVAGGLFLDIDKDFLVPVGAAGLLWFLSIELRAWWRRGMAPGRMEAIVACLALLCVVPAYYLPGDDFALLGGIAGFFIFIILGFVAQVWGKVRETKALIERWRVYKLNLPDCLRREYETYCRIRTARMLWL